ncbi:hypothetical protein [Streptomyces rapamycinicus]|uniref:Uncharacterized protein n=2 Tax=Streptomyces rapamycinicus TaxID=1226757 RepID=A0A0A0NGR4_STRRN|nr:hypothetical protein [Streptomyces rapamycinicus]AGP56169.1 hypothetical protein M271_23275 [Streptomyces rapamycinicus NRRL 5491]MBB4783776.1 hypothetical protein [Streptomyces rapamycinicus]RLV80753.1 hypothetical protein D3C57_120250 [Streptomyces rapamycinicus NRRL 5491]UTO64133.1 hypothetical protein LJB45_18575 [Streptomyces rapamycinicus]UTP32088.1 hypothetical protein LIV37_23695 [Streptomyces rapamycinicus NRRL 5491]
MKLPTFVPTLPAAIETAREYLAQAERADIHDHGRIIESHATLTVCLGQLLAALDAEQGVTR